MTDRELLERYGHVLTDKEREAFELHRVRGMSQRALVLHLGISRSGVQSRLENAQRKLHQALRSEAA